MNTLVLRHNGHEAHVPYELPDSLRFDCFVPGQGVCEATVDVRAEAILVLEVRDQPDWMMSSDAVLEQAGDVCAVFERSLESQRLMSAQYTDRVPEDDVADARVLSTIAEMALLESDLHTAWCRLPEPLRPSSCAPPDPRGPEESHAHHALQRFIEQTLVPRAQDMATAAAKRREAQWHEEQVEKAFYSRHSADVDAAINIAKERA